MWKCMVLFTGLLLSPQLFAQDEYVDRGWYAGVGLGIASVTKKGNAAENVPDHFIGKNTALVLGYKYESPYSLELIINMISSSEEMPDKVDYVEADFETLAVKSNFDVGGNDLYIRFGIGRGQYSIGYWGGYTVGNVTSSSQDWSGFTYLVGGGWRRELNKKWMFEASIDYINGKLESSTATDDLNVDSFNVAANLTFKDFSSSDRTAKVVAGGAGAIIGVAVMYKLLEQLNPDDAFENIVLSIFAGGGLGIVTGVYLVSDTKEHKLALQVPF